MKEIIGCEFVGTCAFGFLVRPRNEDQVLHAYDMDAKFIGVIFTGTMGSDRVKKVIHCGNDLYSFQFENGFKIIKCN